MKTGVLPNEKRHFYIEKKSSFLKALDEEQLEAVINLMKIRFAGPGSGKTRVITYKLLIYYT